MAGRIMLYEEPKTSQSLPVPVSHAHPLVSGAVADFSYQSRAAKKMLRVGGHARTFRLAGSRDVLAQPVHFSVAEFCRGGTRTFVQSCKCGSADCADDRG